MSSAASKGVSATLPSEGDSAARVVERACVVEPHHGGLWGMADRGAGPGARGPAAGLSAGQPWRPPATGASAVR